MPDLAAYYDRLSRWTAVARAVGYGPPRETLTVHRALADPRADGRPTVTRLHDVLADALPPLTAPRVLDAGCGLGGTMIDLAARMDGSTYMGLTLSEKQAAIGREAAERAGHGASIQFLIRSYDTPPVGPYDLIVAIESLAHSPNPSVTVERLAGRLAAGGVFAIVDDMPQTSPSTGAHRSPDLATFKAGWSCPVLWTADDYRAHFSRCGLQLDSELDLTPQVSPRSTASIRRLERLNRVLHRAIPSNGWRGLMDSHHGGLALERLYRQGLMSYRMMIAVAQ